MNEKDKDNNKFKSCNVGYYLPEFEKNKCQKCSIDNCLECYGNKTSNNCTKCNSNLKEGYESNTNRTIISCKLPCEEGNEDKCLKCDNIRNECIECNIGYKLENDKCILNYSFKAIYKQINKSERTNLININLIKEMIIDGKEEKEPFSTYHYFNDTKSHEIYIRINIEKSRSSLSYFFGAVNRMISISFTSLFNTSNIISMSHFFCGCSQLESINNIYNLDTTKVKNLDYFFHYCSSLKSIDLSSFDTKNVVNLSGMFLGCSSLTSIDLSSFDTKNVNDLKEMFYQCSSLKSIDLSKLNTTKLTSISKIFFYCTNITFINIANFNINSTVSLFNNILGKNGTIIANQNIYNNLDNSSKAALVGWTQK